MYYVLLERKMCDSHRFQCKNLPNLYSKATAAVLLAEAPQTAVPLVSPRDAAGAASAQRFPKMLLGETQQSCSASQQAS